MRVLVYEHLCACRSSDSPSLRAEGQAMLAAALEDLAACPGVEPVVAPWDETGFRRLARQARYSLVIAPEFDDILASRCRWAVEEGSTLLGPSVEAVRLTADKLLLADHLGRAGVPTPPTGRVPEAPFPVVCKPRFGAGSQQTALVRDRGAYADYLRGVVPAGDVVVQPWTPGRPVSVACLAGPAALHLLPAGDQHLSDDGSFRYLGGRVPLPPEQCERAWRLARQAAAAVGGLFGYFGLDLVLGPPDVVIEINPRLTTSYVGLRRLARFNLMRALLDVVAGRPLPDLPWSAGAVTFAADGTILEPTLRSDV